MCLCGRQAVCDEAAARRSAVALAETGPVGGSDPAGCSSPLVAPGCAVAVGHALPGAERQYAGRNDRIYT